MKKGRPFETASLNRFAEREGFKPPVPCGTPDFESGTFDHSDTSPGSDFFQGANILFILKKCAFLAT